MTVWIDSHCHVHDARIPGGTHDAVAQARAAGVTAMITVGCDRETSLAAIDAAEAHPEVFATVGLHPHDAVNGTESVADLFDRSGIVAVGEAGLDYFYDHSERAVQRAVFADQIQIAIERRLPLIIHSRDAWDDTFDILAAEGVPDRTVFHCFTGGPTELDRALEIGAFVSFSGIVTFASATEVRAAAARCPEGRFLVETDSPYLAPVPHRGKPNHPAWVAHVGSAIAELRGVTTERVSECTTATARLVFGSLGS